MSLAEIVSVLYAAAGVAAGLFYLPQLWRLLRDAGARRAMSLLTWGGWTAVGSVTLVYAWVVVGEAEMIAVAALNLACQAAVVSLAAGQAVADRRLGAERLNDIPVIVTDPRRPHAAGASLRDACLPRHKARGPLGLTKSR